MELHAFDAHAFVSHAHDLAVRAPRSNLEAFGQGLFFDHERVIAGRDERIRQGAEHPASVMLNRRGLPMHELARMHDASAKRLSYALMAEADAEQRELARKTRDERHRY